MLELQYLRGILLINNLVAAIIGLATSDRYGYWHNSDATDAMSSFLLFSWVMSLAVPVYAKVQLRSAEKQGYIRLPANSGSVAAYDFDMYSKPQMGPRVFWTVFVADVLFVITFILTISFGFVHGVTTDLAFTLIGGIVALVVHLFFVLDALYNGVSKYRIKVSIVRRDEGGLRLRSASRGKEDQPSVASSMHEPEPISPRPYRGSPSTKPSQGLQAVTGGPIKIDDSTEGDSLIAQKD